MGADLANQPDSGMTPQSIAEAPPIGQRDNDGTTRRIGQEIDNFEGGWTKNRQFMGVRTLPEALLSINKRGSVCVHKNSF